MSNAVVYPNGMQAMSRRLPKARRGYPMGNRSGILCEEEGKHGGRKEAEGRREEKNREEDMERKNGERMKTKSQRQSSAAAVNGIINLRRDA